MSNVQSQVITIVADMLDVSEGEITQDTNFISDLGADSLDLVELIMEFEEKFNANISDEDAQKIKTVGEVVNYIEAHSTA